MIKNLNSNIIFKYMRNQLKELIKSSSLFNLGFDFIFC